MRSWIECLFQDAKRGGWKWHQTKMTDPTRAEGHWLAIALATLWLVSVGGEQDAMLSGDNSSAPSSRCSDSPFKLFSSWFCFTSCLYSESSSFTHR